MSCSSWLAVLSLGALGALGAVFLSACETEECKQLQAELEARRGVLRTARVQAGAHDASKKRALAAEGNANKLLHALSLDLPESKIQEELETRAKAISGATIERGAVTVGQPEPGEQGAPE